MYLRHACKTFAFKEFFFCLWLVIIIIIIITLLSSIELLLFFIPKNVYFPAYIGLTKELCIKHTLLMVLLLVLLLFLFLSVSLQLLTKPNHIPIVSYILTTVALYACNFLFMLRM